MKGKNEDTRIVGIEKSIDHLMSVIRKLSLNYDYQKNYLMKSIDYLSVCDRNDWRFYVKYFKEDSKTCQRKITILREELHTYSEFVENRPTLNKDQKFKLGLLSRMIGYIFDDIEAAFTPINPKMIVRYIIYKGINTANQTAIFRDFCKKYSVHFDDSRKTYKTMNSELLKIKEISKIENKWTIPNYKGLDINALLSIKPMIKREDSNDYERIISDVKKLSGLTE